MLLISHKCKNDWFVWDVRYRMMMTCSVGRIFLSDLGGNPNKKNGHDETVLHCVCSGGVADQSYAQKLRRDECLLLVLQWNGARLPDGSMERVDVMAKDEVVFRLCLIQLKLSKSVNICLKSSAT